MSVIYIVLPLAIVLAGLALLGFIWAVRQGQFDDLQTPSLRVLIEEDGPAAPDAPAADPKVGLAGFEPATSRLSSVRSNQLSYKPVA